MDLLQAIDKGRDDLREALEEYQPRAIFAGLSGGTDSLVATHLLHEIRDDAAALHINTGIGLKRTRRYVRDTCELMGWDLVEEKATENGHDYDEMVRGNVKGVPGGFPGPPMHYIYYRRLKERQIEQVHRDHKGGWGGKILLVTGIRSDESQIRAGYEGETVQHHNGVVWVNLIYHVSAHQKQKYIDTYGLDVNPVSEVYGMSGECLCGAFDEHGTRHCELKSACQRFNEPETYERIVSLEREVEDRFPWRWDERAPEGWAAAKSGQRSLVLDGVGERLDRVAQMCVGCGKGPQPSNQTET